MTLLWLLPHRFFAVFPGTPWFVTTFNDTLFERNPGFRIRHTCYNYNSLTVLPEPASLPLAVLFCLSKNCPTGYAERTLRHLNTRQGAVRPYFAFSPNHTFTSAGLARCVCRSQVYLVGQKRCRTLLVPSGGSVGLCFCPGKCVTRNAVKHERNLQQDLQHLKQTHGTTCVLCLLNSAELRVS